MLRIALVVALWLVALIVCAGSAGHMLFLKSRPEVIRRLNEIRAEEDRKRLHGYD